MQNRIRVETEFGTETRYVLTMQLHGLTACMYRLSKWLRHQTRQWQAVMWQ